MERWSPPVELSRQEKMLMKRLVRVRALFGFLRLHRHELFDEAFQVELEGIYRQTGAGDPPHPPALMCMAVILQGYVGASDAEAVELTLVDLRWQMVLLYWSGRATVFAGCAAKVPRANGRARSG